MTPSEKVGTLLVKRSYVRVLNLFFYWLSWNSAKSANIPTPRVSGTLARANDQPPTPTKTMAVKNDSNNVIELFEDNKLWREHEAKAQRRGAEFCNFGKGAMGLKMWSRPTDREPATIWHSGGSSLEPTKAEG